MATKKDDGLDPDEPIKMELIPHEPGDGHMSDGDVEPPEPGRDA